MCKPIDGGVCKPIDGGVCKPIDGGVCKPIDGGVCKPIDGGVSYASKEPSGKPYDVQRIISNTAGLLYITTVNF